MVTLQRSAGDRGAAPAASNGRVLAEFELPSAPGNERRRSSSWRRRCRSRPRASRLERLKTAVGEATMNAMEHGNEYRADRPCRFASSTQSG